jgi:hypothetical protein
MTAQDYVDDHVHVHVGGGFGFSAGLTEWSNFR